MISLQRNIYDDEDDVKQLCSLGDVTNITEGSSDLLRRILARIFGSPADIVQVAGTLDNSFVQVLTGKVAPSRAAAGDVSPVEDVAIFSGERLLYASYDYGRTQVLNLTDDELERLSQALRVAGINPASVIPAPPYPDKT